MNAPVTRLFALMLVLFAVLVGFTSRWTVFEAEALRDNPDNRRELLAEQLIKRGVIRADNGELLAGSRPLSQKRFGRRYPTGPLFAHAVGCTSLDRGRSGPRGLLQRPADRAARRTPIGALSSLLGPDKVGDDLRTTLSVEVAAGRPRDAARQARQQRGAVVAMELDTGAVKVLAAKPSFDPDGRRLRRQPQLRHAGAVRARLDDEGRHRRGGARLRQVRARARRSSGENGKVISGAPLNNFGGEDFGQIDLTTALTNSVNTVWAEVAEKLGKDTMARLHGEVRLLRRTRRWTTPTTR